MTEAELIALIARDEEVSVEFKQEEERQNDLAEVLGAMANSRGGWLLVGVDDNGQILGVSRPKTIIDRLNSAATSVEPSLLGRVDVAAVTTSSNKTVVVAHVPDGLTAIHAVSGVYRMRVGSYNKILTFDQARAMAFRRGILHFEQSPLLDLRLEDLQEEAIQNYLKRRLRDYSPEIYSQLSRFEILRNLGCAVEEQGQPLPTVLGSLFFSAAPDFYVPGSQIIAARFAGTTSERILDRATIRGTLPQIVEAAANFVEKNVRHRLELPHKPGESLASQELPEYPVEAYREIIVNLVAHRDYYSAVPSHLMIFEDRLVAENPGGLLPGLSLKLIENYHRPRNPRLVEMLHTLGYVERFGSGIRRMRSAMQEAGLPEPVFEADENYFRVTLFNSLPSAVTAPVAPPVTLTSSTPLTRQADLRERVILESLPLARLKPRQIEAMRYLIGKGKLTNANYRTVTGVGVDTTLSDLSELLELGVIIKVGTTGRAVHYVLHPKYQKGT
jgi:ATP-dependent DNA helicase RecG